MNSANVSHTKTNFRRYSAHLGETSIMIDSVHAQNLSGCSYSFRILGNLAAIMATVLVFASGPVIASPQELVVTPDKLEPPRVYSPGVTGTTTPDWCRRIAGRSAARPERQRWPLPCATSPG